MQAGPEVISLSPGHLFVRRTPPQELSPSVPPVFGSVEGRIADHYVDPNV